MATVFEEAGVLGAELRTSDGGFGGCGPAEGAPNRDSSASQLPHSVASIICETSISCRLTSSETSASLVMSNSIVYRLPDLGTVSEPVSWLYMILHWYLMSHDFLFTSQSPRYSRGQTFCPGFVDKSSRIPAGKKLIRINLSNAPLPSIPPIASIEPFDFFICYAGSFVSTRG